MLSSMSPTLNYVLSSILADQQRKEEKYTHSKRQHKITKEIRVTIIAFNATFNNISVISWRSVLLVEETRVSGENHRPVASYWQTISHNTNLHKQKKKKFLRNIQVTTYFQCWRFGHFMKVLFLVAVSILDWRRVWRIRITNWAQEEV